MSSALRRVRGSKDLRLIHLRPVWAGLGTLQAVNGTRSGFLTVTSPSQTMETYVGDRQQMRGRGQRPLRN